MASSIRATGDDMAKKYKLIVLSAPVPGREKEYNDWYQNEHLKDMVGIPSILSAQRYSLTTNIIPGSSDPPRYLAIYDIETNDIEGVLKNMASGGAKVSAAMAPESMVGAIYQEFGEAVKAAKA